MLRWNSVFVAAVFAVSLPLAAQAESLKLMGGAFTFAHEPVDKTATEFEITNGWFDGQLVSVNANAPIVKKDAALPGLGLPLKPALLNFTGMGNASGGLIANPTLPVIAQFSGSFAWVTPQGDLYGEFYMQNQFIGLEGVFGATIFITFDGGTGRFANASGEAFAQGLDFPFGGLRGDSTTAGVEAVFVSGNVELE